MTSAGNDQCMAENAPSALPPGQTEVWHVDFHMSLEPDSLSPNYLSCQVSRRVPESDPAEWHMDGIASFECPSAVIPRVGAPLIPYLIYHLREISDWLTTEHVVRELGGVNLTIGPDVGVTVQPIGSVPVIVPEP